MSGRTSTTGTLNINRSVVPTGSIIQYTGSTSPSGWLLCDGTAVSRTTYSSLFAIISTTYGTGDGSTTFNVPDLRSRVAVGAGTGTFTATISSVNTSTEELTITSNNTIYTGTSVLYDTTSGAIGGLTDNTTYFAIRSSATVVQLATSRANAVAGTAINLTSSGSGTQTLTVTYTARSRGDVGGEETHAITSTEMPSHTHTISDSGHSHVIAAGGPAAYAAPPPQGAQGTGTHSTNSATTGISGTNSRGSSGDHNIVPPFVVVNYIIKT